MAGVLQHLRSSTLDKRPNPASMVDGQLAINYASGSPGAFFKDSNGNLVKVGPVHVGSGAPNASPASGGTAGNSIGEQWLDTSGGTYVFKIWDGAAWRSEAGEFVNSTGDTMTGALVMDNQQQVRFRETTANGTNYVALQAPASVASDKTITLPDVTGTVITTGDTGTVTGTIIASGTITSSNIASGTITSSNIADATIVDADISASAEIAVSKLADGAARQLLQTDAAGTGVEWTNNVDIPGTLDVTGAAVFDSTANIAGNLTVDTNTLFVDAANNRVGIGTTSPGTPLEVTGGDIRINQSGSGNVGLNILRTGGTASDWYQYIPSGSDALAWYKGSERMRLDGSGRLLVGTSTSIASDSKLQVKDGAIHIYHANSAASAGYDLRFSTDGGATARTQAAIGCLQATTNQSGGILAFSTTADGASSPTERMRITSGGELLVGGTNDNGAYNIQCNGTGVWGFGAYVNGSDERLKENINPLPASLDVVKALNPVVFQYKPEFTADTSVQPGFIAQELQTALAGQVYVDGVVRAGGQYLNVAYQALIPVLTKALQEAIGEIELLKTRIADLERA